MNINTIGIDISLNSTATTLSDGEKTYILSFNNKKDNNKWITELGSAGVDITQIYRKTSDDYSKNEIVKLTDFIRISDQIVSKIISYLNPSLDTFCVIEGYSFSRNTSSILDIVSLSTLIKTSLLSKINNITIEILSPLTLKLEACKMVYPPTVIGSRKKKLKWVNPQGISGGSFKKQHMFQAFLDLKPDNNLYKTLYHYNDLVNREKIPNPIEDIIDSFFAHSVALHRTDKSEMAQKL